MIPKPLSRNRRLLESIRSFCPDVTIWFVGTVAFFYMGWAKRLKTPLVLVLTEEISESMSIFSLNTLYLLRNIKHTWVRILSMLCPRIIVSSVANSSMISKIIVLSETNRQRLIRIGVAQKKISVIPPGVDPPAKKQSREFEKRLQDRFMISNKDFIVTYMGPPRRIRGTDIAVMATSMLASDGIPVRLLILSRRTNNDLVEIREEARLKSLANKLGIADRVNIVPGILNKESLAAFMYMTDVFIFPFRMIESEVPISPLEAMQIGKPVVSTKTGSMNELLGDRRGILIDPGSTEQLAHTLNLLYDRPEYRFTIAQKAKQWTAQRPSWNDVAELMTKVLRSVIEERNQATDSNIVESEMPSFLCLIGLDGTGKTSHARRLVWKLTSNGIRCRYRWFGGPRFMTLSIYALCRLINLTHTRDRSRGLREHAFYLNQAIAYLLPWVQTFDVILYALVKLYIPHWMGWKIVSDRFIHDVIVDLIADTRMPILKMKVGRILMRLIPRDCSVVLLDADNNVLTSRKHDIPSKEYLIERRKIYSELILSLNIPVVKSDLSFEKTQEIIEARLLHHSISLLGGISLRAK
jgi:glycosyltransferase involved in cell wall biosynthesis